MYQEVCSRFGVIPTVGYTPSGLGRVCGRSEESYRGVWGSFVSRGFGVVVEGRREEGLLRVRGGRDPTVTTLSPVFDTRDTSTGDEPQTHRADPLLPYKFRLPSPPGPSTSLRPPVVPFLSLSVTSAVMLESGSPTWG